MREEVAGEVFTNELMVGFILIEGIDDVVAEAPGVGKDERASAAGGLGEAGDIEPMAAPAFSKFRAGEEGVDHALKCRGGLIF